MGSHPVEKPGIGFIFDVDFQVNQHSPLEKACPATNASLGHCNNSAEASETYALIAWSARSLVKGSLTHGSKEGVA